MRRRKPILIGCPQYRKLVRGTCGCDESGRHRLRGDGRLGLHAIECGQDGGRCMQTLCALHRFNRKGPASWYPSEVLAMRDPPAGRRPRRPGPETTDESCTMSELA